MAKKTVTINQFDGGISDSSRQQVADSFGYSEQLDIFSDPHVLQPNLSLETDNTNAYGLRDFVYANSKLYALGVQDNVERPAIYHKTAAQLLTSNWDLDAGGNGEAAGGSIFSGDFVPVVHCNNYLYLYAGSQYIIRFGSIAAVATWDLTWKDLTSFTNIAKPLVSTRNNGYIYFPYDNTIAVWNGSTWDSSFTLPTTMVITSICEWGQYIAIGCKPSQYTDKSRVYIWDRTSTNFSEMLEWADGELKVLETIGNTLVGISLSSTTSEGNISSNITIGTYEGGVINYIKTLQNTGTSVLYQHKAVHKNRLYFVAKATINGTSRYGVFSVGRNNSSRKFGVTLSHLINGSSAPTNVQSIYWTGDYLWTAFNVNQAAHTSTVKRTNNDSTYGDTALYESQWFNDGTPSKKKRLIGIEVQHGAIPASGSLKVSYRRDGTTTWTDIGTNSTETSTHSEYTTVVATGKNLGDFYEVQFKFTITGNVTVKGFKFVYDDEVKTLLNSKS